MPSINLTSLHYDPLPSPPSALLQFFSLPPSPFSFTNLLWMNLEFWRKVSKKRQEKYTIKQIWRFFKVYTKLLYISCFAKVFERLKSLLSSVCFSLRKERRKKERTAQYFYWYFLISLITSHDGPELEFMIFTSSREL